MENDLRTRFRTPDVILAETWEPPSGLGDADLTG